MLIAIALGSADVTGAFQNQEPHRLPAIAIAVDDAARNHQVVAAPERQIAKLRFEHAFAVAHVNQLVALPVAIEKIVLGLWLDEQRADIVIEQQRNPVENRAARSRQARGLKVPELRAGLGASLPNQIRQMAQSFDLRGLIDVVEQRRRAGEALVAHQFFHVKGTVALPENAVTFVRDLSQAVVNRHN